MKSSASLHPRPQGCLQFQNYRSKRCQFIYFGSNESQGEISISLQKLLLMWPCLSQSQVPWQQSVQMCPVSELTGEPETSADSINLKVLALATRPRMRVQYDPSCLHGRPCAPDMSHGWHRPVGNESCSPRVRNRESITTQVHRRHEARVLVTRASPVLPFLSIYRAELCASDCALQIALGDWMHSGPETQGLPSGWGQPWPGFEGAWSRRGVRLPLLPSLLCCVPETLGVGPCSRGSQPEASWPTFSVTAQHSQPAQLGLFILRP